MDLSGPGIDVKLKERKKDVPFVYQVYFSKKLSLRILKNLQAP
jgi:hypothetical protein